MTSNSLCITSTGTNPRDDRQKANSGGPPRPSPHGGHHEATTDDITFFGHARSRELYSSLEKGRPQPNGLRARSRALHPDTAKLEKQRPEMRGFDLQRSMKSGNATVSDSQRPDGSPPRGPKGWPWDGSPPKRFRNSINTIEDSSSVVSDMTSSSGFATSTKTSSTSSVSANCYDCKKTIEPLVKSFRCSTCVRRCHERCLPKSVREQDSDHTPTWQCRRCVKKRRLSGPSTGRVNAQKLSSAESESSYSPPGAVTPVEAASDPLVTLNHPKGQVKPSPLRPYHLDKGRGPLTPDKNPRDRTDDLDERDVSELQARNLSDLSALAREATSKQISVALLIEIINKQPSLVDILSRLSRWEETSQITEDMLVGVRTDKGTPHVSDSQDLNKPRDYHIPREESRRFPSVTDKLSYLAGWDAKAHNDQTRGLGDTNGVLSGSAARKTQSSEIVMTQPRKLKWSRQPAPAEKTSLSSRSASTAPSIASTTSGELQRKEQHDMGSGSATTPEDEVGASMATLKLSQRANNLSTQAAVIDGLGSPRKSLFNNAEVSKILSNKDASQMSEGVSLTHTRSPENTSQSSTNNPMPGLDYHGPASSSAVKHTPMACSMCSGCGKKIFPYGSRSKSPLCTTCRALTQSDINNGSPCVPETPDASMTANDFPVPRSINDASQSPKSSRQNTLSKQSALSVVPSKRQMPAHAHDNLFHRSKKPRAFNHPAPINNGPIRKTSAVDGPLGIEARPYTPHDKPVEPAEPAEPLKVRGNDLDAEQSPQRGKITSLETTLHKERLQSEALREELKRIKDDHNATQRSDRQSFETELQLQKHEHEKQKERINDLSKHLEQTQIKLNLELDVRTEAEANVRHIEQEMSSLKKQLKLARKAQSSPQKSKDRQVSPNAQIQKMRAEGIVFEDDSDSDSMFQDRPAVRSKPGYGPFSCRHQSCSGLTELTPGHFSANFDRHIKRKEIDARPRKKATFGKVLSSWHSPHACDPRRNIVEVDDKVVLKFTSSRRDEHRKESGASDDETEPVENHGTWSDFVGLPKVLIPTLTQEKELAYRDGAENLNGRLSRAKEVWKVHDKNAPRL